MDRSPFTRLRRLSLLLVVLVFSIAPFVAISEELAEPELEYVTLTVVDEKGAPVAGASVRAVGVQGKASPWGVSFLREPLEAPRTNIQGGTEVPFLRFARDDNPTTEISIIIDHPNFVRESGRRVSSTFPEPVVLESGVAVTLKAHLAGDKKALKAVRANAPGTLWAPLGDGIATRISGTASMVLQAVAFDETGAPLFSDPVKIDAGLAAERVFDLEVKKGSSLNGRLSYQVKRPVQNGRVIANVERRLSNKDRLYWNVSTSVDSAGNFVLENLPEGDVQIVALCEGYVSQNPNGVQGSFKEAQVFQPTKEVIQVPMEETGSAEIEVLSPEGRPIAGARVWFWPNQVFRGLTSIVGDAYNDDESVLKHQLAGSPRRRLEDNKRFTATTNALGKALIKELPAGLQDFSVASEEHELPVDREVDPLVGRSREIEIMPGEITPLTVRMHPNGPGPAATK